MHVVSGHQPAYLPWLGLFHKVALCDVFVVMDDVQYLPQDWNNRNRIKGANGPFWLTMPVSKKASASLLLHDIQIVSEGWGTRGHWQMQHWESIRRAYSRAPYWNDYAPFFEEFYTKTEHKWLVDTNHLVFTYLLEQFGLAPKIVMASEYGFEGKKSDLVLDHCLKLGADTCVFGAHGKDYARVEDFTRHGIAAYFDNYRHSVYPQLFGAFVSNLSAVDLLFNCGPDSLSRLMEGNIDRSLLEDELAKCAKNNQPPIQ